MRDEPEPNEQLEPGIVSGKNNLQVDTVMQPTDPTLKATENGMPTVTELWPASRQVENHLDPDP